MAADNVKTRDDLLLRSHRHLATERELETEAWHAQLRDRYPEPSFFAFGARRDWRAAFAALARIPVEHRTIDAVFFPIWGCEHDEDAPNDEWLPETMLVSADGKFQCFEGHFADAPVVAVRIDRVRRGRVAPSRGYAPDVPNLVYNEHHIVLSGESAERVLSIYGSANSPAVARPRREVPPWCTDAIAAVELSGLEALWAALTSPDASAGNYRASAPAPHWPTLIEASLAAQRLVPEGEEEAAELTR